MERGDTGSKKILREVRARTGGGRMRGKGKILESVRACI